MGQSIGILILIGLGISLWGLIHWSNSDPEKPYEDDYDDWFNP